jgi:hypothetical protein
MPSPHPSARIAVNAQTWRAFRQAALVRGIHVSEYLARLVETELARRAHTPATEVSLAANDAEQSLAALRAVRAAIDELDDIAGRLARSACEHGGSWRDIASSLRLSVEATRRAYDVQRP